MSTFESIAEIITKFTGLSKEDIKPESSLNEDLGVDSLDAVEIVMAVEDEFGISMPNEKTKELKTVDDVVKLTDELKAQ